MSRKLRQLLLVLGVLALVAIVVLILVLLPIIKSMGSNTVSSKPESTGPTIVESHDSKQLISREEADTVSFTVKNPNGTFEFYPTKTDDGITWQIEGYEGLPMITGNLVTLAKFTYDLESYKTVGQVSDLKEYGLRYPVATLTAKYSDGTEFEIKVGDVTSTSQTRRYAIVSGDENVYVISCDLIANLEESRLFNGVLYDLDVQNEAEEWVAPMFDYISITGRDHPEDLMIAPSKQKDPTHPAYYFVYMFTKPFAAAVSNTFEPEELYNLSTLSAHHVVSANPTEAELEKYGFNDPITVKFSVNSIPYSFTVGNVESEFAYIQVEDAPFIYAVKKNAVSVAWKSMSELRYSIVSLINLNTVDTFELDIEGGKSYKIDVERIAATDSGASDKNVATYNGEVLDYFNEYLGVFLEAYREEDITDDVVLGKKLFTVRVKYDDEYEQEDFVAEIYACASNSRRVVYVLNGREDCTVKSSWADKVMADIERILEGKKPM